MTDDLRRVRNDLDVLQDAIGGRLPFAWNDAGLNLLLAAGGFATVAVASSVPVGLLRWSIVPLLACAVPQLLAMRRGGTAAEPVQARRRREARQGVLVAVVVLGTTIPYLLWARHLAAPARTAVGGACILLAGTACAALATATPARRYYWGWALPLIAWGFLFRADTARQVAVTGGVMCVVSGLLTAAIQAWQLRRQEQA